MLVFLFSYSVLSVVMAEQYEFMAYNVENLFDTHHDSEKEDWTFLPKATPGKKGACGKISYFRYRRECFDTDWTEAKLGLKIQKIKKIVGSEKDRPDFLALVEVENALVVGRLAKELGYEKFYVTDSPDQRGVDVALLYRSDKKIQFVGMKEHVVKGEYFKDRPTRNILEVEFTLAESQVPLSIFVNHWPSQGNPVLARMRAAHTLKERIAQIVQKNSSHHVVAVGDFNTVPLDYPHPFNDILLKDFPLFDLHTEFMSDKNIDQKKKKNMPPGTYFYAKEMAWNLLDRVFYSKSLRDGKGLEMVKKSYAIYAPKFAQSKYTYRSKDQYLFGTEITGVPERYDFSQTTAAEVGLSDHFPLVFSLKL